MAFPNNSIPVTNSIGLTAETDDYATHFSEFGNGGLMSFPTRADMYAIPVKRRRFGMECNVTSEIGFIGKYKLSNIAMGGIDNDLTNNNNWKIETIESTGDYYVHYTTGKDIAGAGSIINPFKTLQYAMDNVPLYKRIKVLQDDYYFTGTQKLHYLGTIELQGAIIHVDLTYGEYLIDNFTPHIKGDGTIQIESIGSKFLRHTNSTSCKIEGIKVLFKSFTEGPIEIAGARYVSFEKCIFNIYPNNQFAFIQLFNSENLLGADFGFVDCRFNGIKMKFSSYSNNGGATIKGCSFYGTYSFGSQTKYLEVGKSSNSTRILLIEDTTFDMVSLGGTADTNAAITIYEDDTEITLRNVQFVRYKGTDRYSILTYRGGVKIYAFNCVTFTPVGDGSVSPAIPLQILPPGEFRYYDSLPTYVR